MIELKKKKIWQNTTWIQFNLNKKNLIQIKFDYKWTEKTY